MATGIAARLFTFQARYQGLTAVGDTPENRGECVGLVELWIDMLGLPHVWGDAKDLLANADAGHFRRVNNGPDNYPSPGDIVVWNDSWGSGHGHTAIAVTGAPALFIAFEQNDPIGSTPALKCYDYKGVAGWLVPKVPR